MTITNGNRRPSHFTICRGSCDIDETYDIVHRESDQVIAWLPFWDADAQTKREAQLLVQALNAFRNRGGQIVKDAFMETVHVQQDGEALSNAD